MRSVRRPSPSHEVGLRAPRLLLFILKYPGGSDSQKICKKMSRRLNKARKTATVPTQRRAENVVLEDSDISMEKSCAIFVYLVVRFQRSIRTWADENAPALDNYRGQHGPPGSLPDSLHDPPGTSHTQFTRRPNRSHVRCV